jgi:hypothetical protein
MDLRGIVIKQEELAEIADHEHQIAWRSKRLDELRSNIKPLLQAGVPVEPGRFEATLEKHIGRSVPWGKLFIEQLGEETAAFYKRLYRTHVYFEVRVVEHAAPPLWRGLDGGSTDKP